MNMKKQLEFQRKTTSPSPLKRQISSLQNENKSLLRTNEDLKAKTEESAEKERKATKKVKASYAMMQGRERLLQQTHQMPTSSSRTWDSVDSPY